MKTVSDILFRFPALLAALLIINLLEVSLANAKCRNVKGIIKEKAGSSPDVTTTGTLSGGLSGRYDFTLNGTVPSPARNNILLFVGSSTITTKQGHLLNGADAGAIDSASPGNLVDLITITGGTGAFQNASGQIRVSGNFDAAKGKGASTYKGRICTP
jgi:hypothetical protein